MLNLARTHDFQVNLSPSPAYPAVVNPPSFNWPENLKSQQYTLELRNVSNGKRGIGNKLTLQCNSRLNCQEASTNGV